MEVSAERQPDGNLIVSAKNLCLAFAAGSETVEALRNVSLDIKAGEFVSLIGPSGCGKTTFLRVVAALEPPSSGTVSVKGLAPDEARKARAYGYVFQAAGLYPWRTVAANVRLPLEIMGYGRQEQERRSLKALELVELSAFAKRYPWQLSGGMQQRVSIARALSFDAEILLMDEPFGALDEIVRDRLNEQLLALWRKTGMTVIFVTHSIPEAVHLSTKIVVMSARPGRIAKIIDSPLPPDRPLEIRDTPEFIEIAQDVRAGLRESFVAD